MVRSNGEKPLIDPEIASEGKKLFRVAVAIIAVITTLQWGWSVYDNVHTLLVTTAKNEKRLDRQEDQMQELVNEVRLTRDLARAILGEDKYDSIVQKTWSKNDSSKTADKRTN